MHTLFNPSPFKHPNPIPTLRHLFRSIPIQMAHLHPAALFFKSIPAQIPDPHSFSNATMFKCPSRHRAALFFKCDPVQMPQSAPCGSLSNPSLLKYLIQIKMLGMLLNVVYCQLHKNIEQRRGFHNHSTLLTVIRQKSRVVTRGCRCD